ncbi:MAG: isopeptide-forming domain-containing fimbrial protein, partial [Anaerolineae bacterium]|nr:isopeptide-forming domain-containing fimbrial protein [Anaerolineae bacterium]
MTEQFFFLLILSVGIVGFFRLSRLLRRLATIRLTGRLAPSLYPGLIGLVTVLVALFSLLPVVYAASNDISGRVIKDVEGNSSISDPLDTPLEDVHVYLFRDTGDDVPNSGDTLVAWTLTDATGAYSFFGQPNGTYWVVVESDDINSLGTSVEQTYGGVGALVDPDANKLTAATPRITPGSAFGGQRMLVADGFTTETQDLDKAEHIIRVVLDGSGAGHTNLDFGFGFMKGLAGGYSEFYIPTQMVTTASWNEAPNAAFGSMAGGIWSILRDLDNDTALAGGMHYIISVAASTDNTTIYYDHWEDGYDFDPLNPATADVTRVRNKGQVEIFESAGIPHNPRNPANTYYDGRDRIVVAGGPAVVTLSIFPEDPGSVYNTAWEVLPIKPLQTNYVVPVGEGMTGNGAIDFEQTFLTIQSASDSNTITVDDPSEPGTPDLTVVLNKGQVLDVRHTAPGTIVTGTAPIQVQMIGGYYQGGAASEADGLTIFPKTLWDDEYYNPVESAGSAANDGGSASLYATELYVYNPTANPITIFWQDTSGSGTYSLPANTSRTYSQMSGHFVPIGSASYLKSVGGEKFWAVGEGGVSTNNVNGSTATTGAVHTYYDSGYSLVPGYLLRQDYYMAWAPGDSSTPSATNASSVYVTAVNEGTEIFIDFNGDGVADQTDFDNADGDNNPATGMESSYILNRLRSIQLRDPSNPYTLSGAHIWSNGPTAATWAPYPRTASYVTPSLDAGYSALPLPLEWMDAVLGILKSVDSGTFKPTVGQVATFTLSIPAYQAVEDVIATDTLPLGWNFSSGTSNVSVTKNGVTTSSTANPTTTGNGTTTRETLTWNFVTLLGPGMDDLDPNDYIVIKFTAVTNASVLTGYNQNDTDVCGTRPVGGATQTFCAEDKLAVYVVPLSIDKDTTTPYVAAGGVATYTITFQNTDTVNDLTNLRITDTLPAGFSYVAGSATYTVTDNAPAGDTSPGNGVAPTTAPAGGATNLVWGNWTLGNGDRLTVTFRITVSTLAGTYDNTAAASATLGGTRFTITDNGSTANDLGTPLNADPEEDEDVTVGLDLSGKAWLDNGASGGVVYDGIRNGTESGYANIVVNLLDSTGTYILQTMLTDVNGDYIFRGLAANTTYIVEFGTPPAGHFTTLQDQGSNNTVDSDVNPSTRRVTVPLTTTSVANIDAGFAPYASIGDYVWNDANRNGMQDGGETGISGITVTLYLAATPVQTVTTDASGLYTFTNVVSGTYSVQFTSPATYTFSAADQGGNDNTDSDANPATGRTTTFTANAGQVITNVDAGLYQPATIGDSVWFDLNHDGLQNEVNGLAGITLTLTYPNGTIITTTTSSTGAYSFTVPSNQAYTLTVIPANFAPGGPLAAYTSALSNQGGDDALDSDGQPDGSGGVIFVTPVITQNNDTFDFGFYIPVEPALTKAVSFTPGLTATLGTTVTYVVAVPDPAISRTLTSVVVTDTLNSALYPVTATVSGGLTPTVALNGQDVAATFGAITAGSQARITVTAIISDAAITSGTNIANTVVMTHAQAPTLTTSNPVTTTIGEPSLTVDKSVASSTGSLTNVDSTALLTYTIRLTNSGTSPAYSVRLSDAVPSGISVINSLGDYSSWSGPVTGPNAMTWTVANIGNEPPTNVAVLTYTARISGATAGGNAVNIVTATYHSLTDTVPGGRTYTTITGTATITPARPHVVKTVSPASSAASPLRIGDIITYTIVTQVPPGVYVPWPYQYDYLPAGLRYITGTFAVTTTLPFSGTSLTDTLTAPYVSRYEGGDRGVSGATATVNPNVGTHYLAPESDRQAIEWWLQPLNNRTAVTGLVTATFQVQLVGVDLLSTSVWSNPLIIFQPSNYGSMRWNLQDAGSYTYTVTTDADDSLPITISGGQPNLTLDKHSLPAPGVTVYPGDTITYTLTITNNGRAPAYDLVLTDTLSAGLTYQNTISNPAAGVAITATQSGQLITYTVNQLAAGPGANMVITLVAQVDPSITGGITLTNTAGLPYYDSQPGGGPGIIPPTQRTYTDGSDSVSHPVAIVPGLSLDPDHTQTVPPGQVVTYTHVLTNEGNATDTFTLTVTSVGPFPVTDDVPPSITLTAGQTATFVITVTVPAGASATDQGVTVITAISTLSPALQAVDTDTTNTAAVPGLSLDPDHTATVQPGQVVTYTHVLTNEGNATDTFTLTVTSVGPFPVTDDVPPSITLTA